LNNTIAELCSKPEMKKYEFALPQHPA